MKHAALAVFSLLIISCSGEKGVPRGILGQEKMQEVLWDILRADVYTASFIKHDSAGNEVIENLKLQMAIFKKHNVSRDEFYRSYVYYSNKKSEITVLLDSIIARNQNKKTFKPVIVDKE